MTAMVGDDVVDLERDAARRPDGPVVVAVVGAEPRPHGSDAGQSPAAAPAAAQGRRLSPPTPRLPKSVTPGEAGRIMGKAQPGRRGPAGRPKSGNPIPRPKMPTPASGGREKAARRPAHFNPPRMPGQRR